MGGFSGGRPQRLSKVDELSWQERGLTGMGDTSTPPITRENVFRAGWAELWAKGAGPPGLSLQRRRGSLALRPCWGSAVPVSISALGTQALAPTQPTESLRSNCSGMQTWPRHSPAQGTPALPTARQTAPTRNRTHHKCRQPLQLRPLPSTTSLWTCTSHQEALPPSCLGRKVSRFLLQGGHGSTCQYP